MSQPNLFITGNSSGLGLGLSTALLERGWSVYGLSRRGCKLDGVHDHHCDLAELDSITDGLEALLSGVTRLDLVILNAGILGKIQPMNQTSMEDLHGIMDINVWANKVILDWLHGSGIAVEQIILISSGAAVLGNMGWGGYALSKASLNMLCRLYSHELPNSHLTALAPGLIDTAMMDYLCEEPDPGQYPALARLRDARGTDTMPKPRQAAEQILTALPKLYGFPSGSFVDIRQILQPEEYQALMRGNTGAR